MLLAIDCGNTNTVFSIWDGEAFIATWRTSTEWQRTADQYYVWLSTLMIVSSRNPAWLKLGVMMVMRGRWVVSSVMRQPSPRSCGR